MKRKMIPTDWWQQDWHKCMTPKQKLLWRYLWERCDAIGVLPLQWEKEAALWLGCDDLQVGADAVELDKGDAIRIFYNDVLIIDYLSMQYGALSRRSPAHKPVFRLLEKRFGKDILNGWVAAGLPENAFPPIK